MDPTPPKPPTARGFVYLFGSQCPLDSVDRFLIPRLGGVKSSPSLVPLPEPLAERFGQPMARIAVASGDTLSLVDVDRIVPLAGAPEEMFCWLGWNSSKAPTPDDLLRPGIESEPILVDGLDGAQWRVPEIRAWGFLNGAVDTAKTCLGIRRVMGDDGLPSVVVEERDTLLWDSAQDVVQLMFSATATASAAILSDLAEDESASVPIHTGITYEELSAYAALFLSVFYRVGQEELLAMEVFDARGKIEQAIVSAACDASGYFAAMDEFAIAGGFESKMPSESGGSDLGSGSQDDSQDIVLPPEKRMGRSWPLRLLRHLMKWLVRKIKRVVCGASVDDFKEAIH